MKKLKIKPIHIKLNEANKDLLKIVNLVLYFINKGKISSRNFKKLKYLLYFSNVDYYEKYYKPIVKVHFYKNKKDFEIRPK